MKTFRLLMLLMVPLSVFAQNSKTAPQLGKDPLKTIVAAMTPEEKALLVTGTGMAGFGGPVVGETAQLVPGAAGTTAAIPRLGIPAIVLADGPAGLRINPKRTGDNNTYYCTAFPIATLLASSWDLALVNSVGKAMGQEVLDYGVDVLLAPALNIHRNPLGGRNFEYYSEDPVLAGKMTAAIVNGIQSNGVGTSIKHFAANNHESNRMNIDVQVSERALREIYLKGFSIAVKESKPWTVMSSYNKINGSYTSENPGLLNDILRKEWGYQGLVMTDWFGGKSPVGQMNAGNDLLMPGVEPQRKTLLEGLTSGTLKQETLDQNVTRVLELILQSPRFKKHVFSNKPDLTAHALVSRNAAASGMVLLKNEGQSLPLTPALKKVAAFGNTSYEIVVGGTGSGDVYEAYSISLIQGLQNDGRVTDNDLQEKYLAFMVDAKAKAPKPANRFAPLAPIAERDVTSDEAAQKAETNDFALITIGRSSGEFSDRKVENDFNLSDAEKNMIQRVTTAFHAKGKKAIVILNIGGVIETASWKELPDAILLAWQPGQEAGNAIADVLSGKVNPSGKLTSTFPLRYSDVPSAKNFPGLPINNPLTVNYQEGIYVGYRYYNTFNKITSYPFGYGMSYTQFSYGPLKLEQKNFNKMQTAKITVTNTGKTAGREVAQLYLTAPGKDMEKPAQELKAFAKTRLLQPGESEELTFKVDASAIASFSSEKSAWVAETGTYTIKVGSSSENIKQQAVFNVPKMLVIQEVDRIMLPANKIEEIHHSK